MERGDSIILVTGATGHQGGASARHLLHDGWRVRALTRHPDGAEARALAALGAETVRGDLLDRASIDEAVRGAYGVHGVESTREAGPEGEETEGRNLADAAMAAGVQHFVYSSVFNAGQAEPGEPWVIAKQRLEAYLRDLGLPWTIWRPTLFMENFLRHRDDLSAGVLKGLAPPDSAQEYIAVDDIGGFVALAFRDRDAWLHKTTIIAGDRLTQRDQAQVFGRVLGHTVRYVQTEPPPGMPAPGTPPERADIERLRRLLPGLKTLEAWARTMEWAPDRAAAR